MTSEPESPDREPSPGLGTQIHRNLLSIISLVVALTALGYNTYRNELTEHNRNIRSASFIILQELSQLQRAMAELEHREQQDKTEKDKLQGYVQERM